MGTRRSTACAALVAALLLAMAAPALAVVTGPVSEQVDETERTAKDVVADTDDAVADTDDAVGTVADEIEEEVEETADEIEEVADEVLRDDPDDDDSDDGSDDGGTAGDDDDDTREARDDRSRLATVAQAVNQAVAGTSPLPVLRVDQSHQTSLQRFRIADMVAADVLEVPPTLDEVLAPVVRADTDEVSPANETPIIAAPAHSEAIAATPDRPGYAALAAALLIVLVSTALLAEVRAGGPERA